MLNEAQGKTTGAALLQRQQDYAGQAEAAELTRYTASQKIRNRLEMAVNFASDVREKANRALADISSDPFPCTADQTEEKESLPKYFEELDGLIDLLNVHLKEINDQLRRVEF